MLVILCGAAVAVLCVLSELGVFKKSNERVAMAARNLTQTAMARLGVTLSGGLGAAMPRARLAAMGVATVTAVGAVPLLALSIGM